MNLAKIRMLLLVVILSVLALHADPLLADVYDDDLFIYEDDLWETQAAALYEQHVLEWIMQGSPLLSESDAIHSMMDQFPHLRAFSQPVLELHDFDTPGGLLLIYTYSWSDQPDLLIEQNAINGELIQYVDFTLLYSIYEDESNTPPLSLRALQMLAEIRLNKSCSTEKRDLHYPTEPEIQVEDEGIYVFIWTKHYLGIPNYGERFVIVLHPYSGMPVLVIEETDYALLFDDNSSLNILPIEEALTEVRKYIEPVLIYIPLDDSDPGELLWFSGITISAFLADGSDLQQMPKEEGDVLPADLQLSVDRDDAWQRFADSLTLNLQWYAEDYYTEAYGFISVLIPIYTISFTPVEGSLLNVIPAIISDAELVAKVEAYYGD
ncbi:MAG: hypothetical protein FWE76_01485 [Symbiobacteriaceae bacterium]|nr:hypothetical protein [Symbiobacteriaceae bacterium]